MSQTFTALGLMSGTSLDGIDAAIIETDGHAYVRPIDFISIPYTPAVQKTIRSVLGRNDVRSPDIQAVERTLTEKHIEAVRTLLNKSSRPVDIIGFHGQTILHNIQDKITIQIGDGALMAAQTGIDTVNNFRLADVQNGGQGAPLLPLYHQARARSDALLTPLAILNIGGVANVTYMGNNDLLAFDTGPGCALIDDFVKHRTGQPYDQNGTLAATGTVHQNLLDHVLALPFFDEVPPKSLDRDTFKKPEALRGGGLFTALDSLSTADGTATLTAFTIQSIVRAQDHLPTKPDTWLITGGGRLNAHIMTQLSQALNVTVKPVESVHWNGDAVEAEGFAYLAVRSILGLPLSVPGTTGVTVPQTGGTLHKAMPNWQRAV